MALLEIDRPVVTAAKYERGSFTGSASEYFGIWIVNVLLTIITVGIYSAWAKVRRKRYFYGNTVLLGRSFEYHARGMQIFIGRAIALAIIVGSQLLTLISPFLAVIPPIVLLVFLPWLVMRSLRFNARVTSYRNVRFDFAGTTGGAFVAVILGSFVAFLSIGILAPFASRWLNRYIFNNLRYGDRAFHADPKIGSLYGAWVAPAVMVVIGGILAGLLGFALLTVAQFAEAGGDYQNQGAAVGVLLTIYVAIFSAMLVFGLAGFVYRAGVRNVVWSATKLDGRHEMLSDLSRSRYTWIVISNFVVTLLTLGLMRPWAAVREARYMAEHSAIRFNGDVGEVFSSIQSTGSAISAEYMDMEGFDFGF